MEHSKLLLFTALLIISACNLATAEPPARGEPTAPSSTGHSLANTQWMLKSFGSASVEQMVAEKSPITLKFEAGDRAGGSGGCNSYGSNYQVQGNRLSFGPILSTKRACLEDALTQQEQQYFRALESAGTFTLTDDRLTIFSQDGRSVLNFVKTSSAR